MPWTALARLWRVQDWLHNTGWTFSYHFVCRLPVSTLQLANQTICLWWSGPHNHESVSSMYISNILSQNKRCHGTQISTIWFPWAEWRSISPSLILLYPTSLGRPDTLINQEGYENSRAYFHKIRCLGQFLMPACFFFIFQLCWRYKIDVEYMYNTWSCYSHCINGTPIRPACSYLPASYDRKPCFLHKPVEFQRLNKNHYGFLSHLSPPN